MLRGTASKFTTVSHVMDGEGTSTALRRLAVSSSSSHGSHLSISPTDCLSTRQRNNCQATKFFTPEKRILGVNNFHANALPDVFFSSPFPRAHAQSGKIRLVHETRFYIHASQWLLFSSPGRNSVFQPTSAFFLYAVAQFLPSQTSPRTFLLLLVQRSWLLEAVLSLLNHRRKSVDIVLYI